MNNQMMLPMTLTAQELTLNNSLNVVGLYI